MYITFQQGIITYPVAGNLQAFLEKTGSTVSLRTANGQVDVAFAHGTSNYLFTEASDVDDAWGPITNGVDTWLYWDLNLLTAVRTFGTTTLAPIHGSTPGYQDVSFTSPKTLTSTTGLANDVTVYTATIAVDGGLPFPVAVTGEDVQTYAQLIAAILADVPTISITLTGEGLRLVSDTTGATSSVVITDTDLFSSLATFDAIEAAVPGVTNTFPVSPATGQHFFDTEEKQMYVFQSGTWQPVLRVFAAKVNTATFTPLGSGFPLRPYAGTQVGLFIPNHAGRILVDSTATPISKANGEFFTTEDDFFVNGSPVNTIRLEANVLNATALTPLAAFQVVKISSFGKMEIATYNDIQTTILAMLMQGVTTNQPGTIVMQGTITNPSWNFSTVGAPLWIDGSGVFTETDPHVTAPITFPNAKPPIARVITPTMIFFDQGLGGIGETGLPGTNVLATNSVPGITMLSIAAANPLMPVAVGDNDPRFDTFVLKAGDTMTGFLTLNADPTAALHAATKQYVDTVASGVSEPANQIVYGTGAGVDSDADLTWNPTTNVLTLGTDGYIVVDEHTTAAATPPAGSVALYAKADGLLYSKDDAGTETPLSGGGGGGAEPDNQIVYGSGGGTTVDSDPDFTYNPTTGAFYVNTIDGSTSSISSSTPGEVAIIGVDGNNVSGGNITITSGSALNATTSLAAGDIMLLGGVGGDRTEADTNISNNTASGGDVTAGGGLGGSTTITAATVTPRTATSSVGGAVAFTSGNGGSVSITGDGVSNPGSTATAARGGHIQLTASNGGDAEVIDDTLGAATGGNGGSIILTAGAGGLATANATPTDGTPGTIDFYLSNGTVAPVLSARMDGFNGTLRLYTLTGNLFNISAESALTGTGGDLSLLGGDAVDNNAGAINIYGGTTADAVATGGYVAVGGGSNASGVFGAVHLQSTAALAPNSPAWDDSVVFSVDKGVYQTSGEGDLGVVVGGARAGSYVLRTQTLDNTQTELFIDGTGGSVQMVLSNDSTWYFEIKVVARRADANDESAAYKYEGAIDRNATAATTALVGTVTETIVAEDTPAWSVLVDADTTNGALRIQVTGELSKEIHWLAFVRTVEILG